MADLTEWPTAIQPPARGPRQSSGEKTELPFEEFRDALMAVPNDASNPDADGRDWWLKMLAAVHHETDGSEEGLELVQNWSAQHESYDRDGTESVWQSFLRGEGATGATVLYEARKRGWRGETERAQQDALIDSCWTPQELAERGVLDDETRATIEELMGPLAGPIKEPAKSQRLTFLSPSDCETLPARRYVVKGLLAAGDLATIVGAPGAGKSLLAPYMVYIVARGDTAFDRRTRQGTVFYVAAEDPLGMRARAWKRTTPRRWAAWWRLPGHSPSGARLSC